MRLNYELIQMHGGDLRVICAFYFQTSAPKKVKSRYFQTNLFADAAWDWKRPGVFLVLHSGKLIHIQTTNECTNIPVDCRSLSLSLSLSLFPLVTRHLILHLSTFMALSTVPLFKVSG